MQAKLCVCLLCSASQYPTASATSAHSLKSSSLSFFYVLPFARLFGRLKGKCLNFVFDVSMAMRNFNRTHVYAHITHFNTNLTLPTAHLFDVSIYPVIKPRVSNYHDQYNISWTVESFEPIFEYRLLYRLQANASNRMPYGKLVSEHIIV